MLATATPTISGFTATEMSQLPTRLRDHRIPKLRGRRGGTAPFEPLLNGGTPPLKSPPYSIFRTEDSRKTINVFSHFHGLIPDTNYKHLECFVMLGTQSELRRGQMSHICDISPLRVNLMIS